MKPVSPVIPGSDHPEVIIAETQDEYGNMPAIIDSEGVVLTRWKLTEEEIAFVSAHGYILHYQHTFNQPVQPISMTADRWVTLGNTLIPGDTNPKPTQEKCTQRPPNAENHGLTVNENVPKDKLLAFDARNIPVVGADNSFGRYKGRGLDHPFGKRSVLNILSSGDPETDKAVLEQAEQTDAAIRAGNCPNGHGKMLVEGERTRRCVTCGFVHFKSGAPDKSTPIEFPPATAGWGKLDTVIPERKIPREELPAAIVSDQKPFVPKCPECGAETFVTEALAAPPRISHTVCANPRCDWIVQDAEEDEENQPRGLESSDLIEEVATCGLCGKPMPEGEETFNYHGYSGPCPE